VIVHQIRPGVRFRLHCTCVLFKEPEDLTDADILSLEDGL
jgi:hypothetical protein